MSKTVSKQDFAQLVRLHAQQVIGFTARLLPDRREAEEVAQDTFVRAYQSLSSFRGEAPLLTWLLHIAYRESMNRLRRRQPRTVDIADLPIVDEEVDLSTRLEKRIQLLEEAITDLPPDDQLLLHLYYYDDRPLRDIAYIMDAEPNALGVRLYRIRKRLEIMIKQREHE